MAIIWLKIGGYDTRFGAKNGDFGIVYSIFGSIWASKQAKNGSKQQSCVVSLVVSAVK
jgi:hypothetical protein